MLFREHIAKRENMVAMSPLFFPEVLSLEGITAASAGSKRDSAVWSVKEIVIIKSLFD